MILYLEVDTSQPLALHSRVWGSSCLPYLYQWEKQNGFLGNKDVDICRLKVFKKRYKVILQCSHRELREKVSEVYLYRTGTGAGIFRLFH